ncbi:hypothetical protein NP493_312g09026 [Ridgeia piscesae]|uniref:Uncharacterized protein n=1 Tax=Ridgeia piscesae TaxID=27915 RepID=A0AAD9L513_RIDPI|nr:hypothetical protein NP493_312g09026 [Ridgeia piscesae]
MVAETSTDISTTGTTSAEYTSETKTTTTPTTLHETTSIAAGTSTEFTTDINNTTTKSPNMTSSAGTVPSAPGVCPLFLPQCLDVPSDNQLIINGTSCTGSQYFRCCGVNNYMRFGCNHGVLTAYMHQTCSVGTNCTESTDCSLNPC